MAQNSISLFPRLEEPISSQTLPHGVGRFLGEPPYNSVPEATLAIE
jgi:hypothetical protein